MEDVQVLRVASPEIMRTIMQSRASRYLSEPLGPTTCVIKQGSMTRLSQVLIELGYLGEIKSGL